MSPIVGVWIGLGILGMIFDLAFLWFFNRDRLRLKRDHLNGGDHILNTMYMGVGVLAVGKHVGVISVGVAASLVQNASGGKGPALSPVSYVITGGLFLETLLTVLTPAWVLWQRGNLRRYLASIAGTQYLTHLLARYRRAGVPNGGTHGSD